MSFVRDSTSALAAAAGLGIVLIGGIYYIVPTYDQNWVNTTVADLLFAPIAVAAQLGSNIGNGIMEASGYQSEESRRNLFAQANVRLTPENAAQTLHEIMLSHGGVEELTSTRDSLLGQQNNIEWNTRVAHVYLRMYNERIDVAFTKYLSQVK
jgi:hypothetical protein